MTEHLIPQPRALTLSEVRAAANEIVAERPSHRVLPDQCFYRDDDTGEPICLVGAILHKLDPDLFERFKPYDTVARGRQPHLLGNSASIISLSQNGSIGSEWEMGVETYLGDLQTAQDGGAPWGFSLDRAEKQLQTLNDGRL